MPDRATVEIRSFRSVFDLERRLYRIDRMRLNPSGVPVRGLVYVALLVLAVLVAQRLPLIGWPIRALPWQARYAALPGAGAALLTMLRIDGRPAQAALASITRFALAPHHLSGFARCPRTGACWTPGGVTVIDDGGSPARTRFRGPGAVLIGGPHRLERRGRRLVLSVGTGSRTAPRRVLVIRRGVTLVVAPVRRR
ncbi:MAG: hypothetical protein QOH72_2281 [Solirubrobacteraceae bacterium]|nr:hypothetical protein [Solirubrobacteraceae bacterium]